MDDLTCIGFNATSVVAIKCRRLQQHQQHQQHQQLTLIHILGSDRQDGEAHGQLAR
jgi:hypothetical protein